MSMANQSMAVSDILKEWNEMKTRLENLFRDRDQKNAKIIMEKGIALFIHFLCVTNERAATPRQAIPYQQFTIQPVNLEERLEFIISRPHLYHSYRQLAELMVELEKLFVKKNIRKKSSGQKG